jgi:DNA-binding PadR family transcriptional regulator
LIAAAWRIFLVVARQDGAARERGFPGSDGATGFDGQNFMWETEGRSSSRLVYVSAVKFWQIGMSSSINPVAFAHQSPLRGALVALLVQGPSYGYELANRLERQLGPGWTIQRPSLYRMLHGLHEKGLISPISGEKTDSSRVVYRATEFAEPAVVAWMSNPVSLEHGQLQLQARMVVARQEDLPRLVIALGSYERALFARRAEVEEGLPARHSLRAAMMTMVRDASIQRIRGELQWVDKSRRRIHALMEA